jgi:hypothetical protein
MIRFFINLYYTYFRSYAYITKGMTKMIARLEDLEARKSLEIVALERMLEAAHDERVSALGTSEKFKELFGLI